jgi:outer membrane lipoprotein-sorting protein
MKKLLFLLTGLLLVAVLTAQSLEEIVKKYSTAINSDQLANVNTIKIKGKMSAMGMDMPMEMFMKNPNKIKVVYSLNGQSMVSIFDGEKGYTINPMMGSSEPIELTGDQLKQIQNNNVFRNEVLNYFNKKQLSLEGEEDVKGKPAYKLKVAVAGSSPVYMFIDKATNLLVKTSSTADQGGTQMNVESYMTDYTEINGVVMPKKTTAVANGMEAAVITFDLVEVNVPMDDSVFKVK